MAGCAHAGWFKSPAAPARPNITSSSDAPTFLPQHLVATVQDGAHYRLGAVQGLAHANPLAAGAGIDESRLGWSSGNRFARPFVVLSQLPQTGPQFRQIPEYQAGPVGEVGAAGAGRPGHVGKEGGGFGCRGCGSNPLLQPRPIGPGQVAQGLRRFARQGQQPGDPLRLRFRSRVAGRGQAIKASRQGKLEPAVPSRWPIVRR